jgi:hypothetical protein
MTSAVIIAVILFNVMGEAVSLSEKIIQLLVMMMAGAAEGFFLGYFQWRVIKKRFIFITGREWIGYTALAGITGWFLGMLYPLFFVEESALRADGIELPVTLIAVVFPLLLGLFLGLLFGGYQWLSLRHHASGAKTWIWANALAWGLAMVWIFGMTSLPSESTAPWIIICLGILTGILAGGTLGAITGFFFQKMEIKKHLPEGVLTIQPEE